MLQGDCVDSSLNLRSKKKEIRARSSLQRRNAASLYHFLLRCCTSRLDRTIARTDEREGDDTSGWANLYIFEIKLSSEKSSHSINRHDKTIGRCHLECGHAAQ